MYYVYIIMARNGELYKGSTDDLIKRVEGHNQNKVKSTKNKGKWRLIYYEGFLNKTDTLREEKFLKTGKGRERIKYLLTNTIEEVAWLV